MVHLFGSGHSRILVEEMWPRYGSFPGFNPIVELSLSFHNLVVGANGQRQAMFLENVSGLAERILRNFDLSPKDCALVASSSGCTKPGQVAGTPEEKAAAMRKIEAGGSVLDLVLQKAAALQRTVAAEDRAVLPTDFAAARRLLAGYGPASCRCARHAGRPHQAARARPHRVSPAAALRHPGRPLPCETRPAPAYRRSSRHP